MVVLTTHAKWSGKIQLKKKRKIHQSIMLCSLLLLMFDVVYATSQVSNNSTIQPRCVLHGNPGMYFNYSLKQIVERYAEHEWNEQIEVSFTGDHLKEWLFSDGQFLAGIPNQAEIVREKNKINQTSTTFDLLRYHHKRKI